MKKTILSSIFVIAMLGISNKSIAQSVSSIKTKAIAAAKHAGCTAGYRGTILANATVIGQCQCGSTSATRTKYEVYITRPSTPTTRFAPFAKVVMCGNTVLSVTCL